MTHDLNSLLGREGYDIGCDACFAEIDRYVELELAGADADRVIPGMRLHLESCAACRDEYESLRVLAAER
jgi:hypothetical protein